MVFNKIIFVNINNLDNKPITPINKPKIPVNKHKTRTSIKSNSSNKTKKRNLRHNNNNNNNEFVFDKQKSLFCGGHAINNLLQKMIVTYNNTDEKGISNKPEYINGKLNLDFIAEELYQLELILHNNEIDRQIYYKKAGDYNINVLIIAINKLGNYNSDIIYKLDNVINILNNKKLVGFILNIGDHYQAIRIKEFNKVNNLETCNLHLEENKKNNSLNKRVAVIDSLDDNCSNKILDCKTLYESLENYFAKNGNIKQGYGLLYVLDN